MAAKGTKYQRIWALLVALGFLGFMFIKYINWIIPTVLLFVGVVFFILSLIYKSK